MRIEKRLVALFAVVLAGVTCSFPTDDSDKVFVTISSLDTSVVVRRGEQLQLYARMYHASGADTTEIQNVQFAWTSDNQTIATVTAGGFGSAGVTGVNSGTVNISARAVAFEKAQNAQFLVRVANPVEVDSVRPRFVRYGDTVRVFGVGVDSIFFVQLEEALLLDYPVPGILPTRVRDSVGFSQALFWVPPPARTGQILYFGNGVFGFASDTTRVLPFDVYEPNEKAPWPVDLEAPPIVPTFPALRFFNPAIAFEQIKRDAAGADWYRFRQTTPRDLSIIINSAEVRGTFDTYVSDSLYWNPADSNYYVEADSWTVGPGTYFCHGEGFFPGQVSPESTIVALRRVPVAQDTLHALSLYAQPGRYGLTVLAGYVVSDPSFPADAHEEDDFCSAADARAARDAAPGGFRDTLTIDNPHEVDWYRIRVPDPGGGVPTPIRFRTASLVPNDTTSDVDFYVLTVPGGGASPNLVEVGSGQHVGSAEDTTLTLFPGHYYAVFVDFIGEPTRYAICIGSSACGTAFPAPSALASAVESRRRKAAAPPRSSALRPAKRFGP